MTPLALIFISRRRATTADDIEAAADALHAFAISD
jgi:hypothetical protein